MSSRSLIVGATGQVGSALVNLLGTAALPASRSGVDGQIRIDLAELADKPSSAAALLENLDLDAVYRVGGATNVDRCEAETEWAMSTNCRGPAALAKAADARDLPFVYFSTDYVFDGKSGPYSEDAPTNPISIYGRSKLLGEEAVSVAHPSALILRTNVVYGPDPQRKNFLYTLQRLLSTSTPMRVPIDQISTPTYNADLAQAAVDLVRGGHSDLWHVSGAEPLSRYDFALLAAEILGLDASLVSPVTTGELNQLAARPLAAGLRIEKLRAALPSWQVHSNAEAIRAWQQREMQGAVS